MRTIRVTGKGQLTIRPDMTRITVNVEGTFPEYGEALRRSAENTEGLSVLLSPFGFERRDLKTLNFSVDTEYERYRFLRRPEYYTLDILRICGIIGL